MSAARWRGSADERLRVGEGLFLAIALVLRFERFSQAVSIEDKCVGGAQAQFRALEFAVRFTALRRAENP
jgi:hypothetical protein